ncbi:hypothetical protein GCM10020254_48940 [Streptomyces goshikiensis]
MSETFWTLNPRTPRPFFAAIAYEEGDPAAYHMAGWAFPYGLGKIFRGGSDQCLPWNPSYSSLEEHLGELRDGLLPDLLGVVHVRDAGHEAEDLVAAGAAPGAELEAPPGEVVEHGDLLGHLHRVVDGGERVEDAGAEVDALGGVGEVGEEHLVRRQVRVLLQEVVLGGPGVLEAGLVGLDDVLGLLDERLVLRLGVDLGPRLRHVSLHEEPEFQGVHRP